MLADRNDVPEPVGRGHSRDAKRGGYPAGAVTRETFNWWKQQFDTLLASEEFAKLREQRDLLPLSATGDELDTLVHKQVAEYKALAGEFGLMQ